MGVAEHTSLPSRERGLKFALRDGGLFMRRVAPFAGAWIEIIICLFLLFRHLVAPFAGAWIEILLCLQSTPPLQSLPSRERGLKSTITPFIGSICPVAPFAGAWIEILVLILIVNKDIVAPFAGAWIEI